MIVYMSLSDVISVVHGQVKRMLISNRKCVALGGLLIEVVNDFSVNGYAIINTEYVCMLQISFSPYSVNAHIKTCYKSSFVKMNW